MIPFRAALFATLLIGTTFASLAPIPTADACGNAVASCNGERCAVVLDCTPCVNQQTGCGSVGVCGHGCVTLLHGPPSDCVGTGWFFVPFTGHRWVGVCTEFTSFIPRGALTGIETATAPTAALP